MCGTFPSRFIAVAAVVTPNSDSHTPLRVSLVGVVRKLPVSETIAIGLGILVATGTSLAALAVLFRTSIANEAVFLILCGAAFVVPLVLVLWFLYPESLRSLFQATPVEVPEKNAPWLDLEGDEEQGYALTADPLALERLGIKCIRLARESSDGEVSLLEIGNTHLQITRQESRPRPPALTWKDRLASMGCILLMLLLFGTLIRGCFALQRDVTTWVK